MDFALNEEQQEYKDRCRTFAREAIRPAACKHDEEESIPYAAEVATEAMNGAGEAEKAGKEPVPA